MKKIKKCEHCGSAFFYDRVTAKYCSDACKQQAYLERISQRFTAAVDAEEAEIESFIDIPSKELIADSSENEMICEPEIIEATDPPKSTGNSGNSTSKFRRSKNKASDIKNNSGKAGKESGNPNREEILGVVGVAILGAIFREIIKNTETDIRNAPETKSNDNKEEEPVNNSESNQTPEAASGSTTDFNDGGKNVKGFVLNRLVKTAIEFIKSAFRLSALSGLLHSIRQKVHINRVYKHLAISPEAIPEEQAGAEPPSCKDTAASEPDKKEAEASAKPAFLDPKIIEEFINRTRQANNKATLDKNQSGNIGFTQKEANFNPIPDNAIHQDSDNNQKEPDLPSE